MIMTASQMAQAAPCIRVRYTGRYSFASLVLNVGTVDAPFIQLGVSNTSLADAVSNDETVITSDGTLNLRDVIASINNWNAATASHDVLEREFQAELWNGLFTDVFGGSVNQYAAAAGTLQLKNTWQSALLIDDDVSGHSSLMLPPPNISKDVCVVSNIEGVPGTSGTPTVTRTIYDKEGNALWTTGAIATATSALLNPSRPTFTEPVIFSNGPVVIRDTCASVGHNTSTNVVATWGIPRQR